MDTRNVTVTLDKAREWYNSGNATLREVALQAFTEDKLNINYVNRRWKMWLISLA